MYNLFVCLSVCLSIYLFVYLFIYLFIYVSVAMANASNWRLKLKDSAATLTSATICDAQPYSDGTYDVLIKSGDLGRRRTAKGPFKNAIIIACISVFHVL